MRRRGRIRRIGPSWPRPARADPKDRTELAAAVAQITSGEVTGEALERALRAVLVTDRGALDSFRFWQVGSVAGRDATQVLDIAPFLVVGLVLSLTAGPTLNAVALGDDLARGLGQHVALHRGLAAAGAVMLAACACALAGPIAFVGLIVPHGVRAAVGPDYRLVLPLSCGYGAVLIVAADTVGRMVLPPSEVQVGIMTAVIGVPVFLHLIRRGRIGAL